MYCSDCLVKWEVENSMHCPNLCANVKYTDIHRFLRNILSNLEFKCLNEGCEEDPLVYE